MRSTTLGAIICCVDLLTHHAVRPVPRYDLPFPDRLRTYTRLPTIVVTVPRYHLHYLRYDVTTLLLLPTVII